MGLCGFLPAQSTCQGWMDCRGHGPHFLLRREHGTQRVATPHSK